MKLIAKQSFALAVIMVALFVGAVAAGEWRLNQSDAIIDSFTQDYGRAIRDKSVEMRPLTVAGVVYREGIGTHANSQTYILLDGRAESIKGLVGVDAGGMDRGSVFFSIVDCDTFEVLWESDFLRSSDKAVPFEVPLKGVGKISLRVSDSGDGINNDHANWLDVRIRYQGKRPVLSDAISEPTPAGNVWKLNRESMEFFTQGWGKALRDLSVEGRHLSVAGFRYDEGVGTHTNGEVFIALGGGSRRITGLAGVDDSSGGKGSVVFQIINPDANRILWDSKLMKSGEYPKRFSLPLDGVNTLYLRVTDAGDGHNNDHADWIDVRILYDGTEPALIKRNK